MQKIFQDAKAHLQLDIAFASSPGGSIESRLPSRTTPSLSQASSQIVSARQLASSTSSKDWRYSTAPGLLAQAHIDVREPLPEQEPLLPDLSATVAYDNGTPTAEPVSSGFNTPEDHNMETGSTENDQMLPLLPDSSAVANRFVDVDAATARHLSSSPSQKTPLLTDLEGPLTELDVNRKPRKSPDIEDVLPAIAYLQTQSSSPETQESGETSGDQPIFLSAQAKAAAESARAKRGLQRSELRSTSNKENVPPGMICPDPSVHTDRKVTRCPDPRRHPRGYNAQSRMSTPSNLARQSDHHTPNTFLHNHQPSPSPLRASLYPPAPCYRRADSRGSPLPTLKVKSPPISPEANLPHQRRSYFSGPSEYARPLTAFNRPPTGYGPSLAPAEHFRPGWSHYPPPESEPRKPTSLTYAFSTAAAKLVGSSPAPDLRIRDSYRTDTLTPLTRPASRFRKNGIGAIAARGQARPPPRASYSPWPTTTGPGNGRLRAGPAPSRHGMASPDHPRFLSSPPRQTDYSACMPMKRRRPVGSSRNFDIAEDDTAASLPGTPMEIDEDIQAAVRMSIVGVPDTPVHEDGQSFEPVKQLSPNVSPFRKGRGLPLKRPRTASYWDHDLPEVRRMDQPRMKRPATMEAGTPRVKSMRVSGIRSSPPRMTGVSKSTTLGSASIYSQAGMSEMSRPATRARLSDEKVGDVEMGMRDEAEGDGDSVYTDTTIKTAK